MALVEGPAALPESPSPYHFGQQAVQTRCGVRESIERTGKRVIRTYMNDQAKAFFQELPLLFAGVKNTDGCVWATTLCGQPGFMQATDDHHLRIKLKQVFGDPAKFTLGAAVGSVGVMQHNRRRNKLNGFVQALEPQSLNLQITQSMGNCPKYIQVRTIKVDNKRLASLGSETRPVTTGGPSLGEEERAFIARSDTAFLATSFSESSRSEKGLEICNCNHRGGAPGFVKVVGNHSLLLPDYIGNSMFQSLGNIVVCPAAGLQFIDFSNGDTLQLTGQAELLYEDHTLPGAQRAVYFKVERWVHVLGGLPILTSGPVEPSPYNPLADKNSISGLKCISRRQETHDIVTFAFGVPVVAPGKAFCEAGQFASFDFPKFSKDETFNRTWTISSSPEEAATKRQFTISVKKAGIVSSWLHDNLKPGMEVVFRGVDGEFTFDKTVKTLPSAGILLIAGGIGVTPMRVLYHEGIRRGLNTTLLYTFRTMADAAFLSEFEKTAADHSNVRVAVAITSASAVDDVEGVPTFHERINAAMIKKVCPDVTEREVFQCGPAAMMKGVSDALESLSVSTAHIHQESFNF